MLVSTSARKVEGPDWVDLDAKWNLTIRRQTVRKTGGGLATSVLPTDANTFWRFT